MEGQGAEGGVSVHRIAWRANTSNPATHSAQRQPLASRARLGCVRETAGPSGLLGSLPLRALALPSLSCSRWLIKRASRTDRDRLRLPLITTTFHQKINKLNISLFTPCLLFSRVAFTLTPAKLKELWIVPVGFVVVSGVSTLVAWALGTALKLKRSQR